MARSFEKKQIMKLNMSSKWFALALVATSMSIASCSKSDPNPVDPNPNPGNGDVEVIEGKITSNKVLSASKTYLLKGYVQVMDGATLEIPAGTIIKERKRQKPL
ncbi:hypothetical protein KUH03_06985 [Sphingobacterium sp. E70]|uniref:hypothetical protein n=1 Tax=Sphingobacterium sp. E70 TaxID=2853439 RepID=UPI00211C5BF3|nr:hypothetical protein [Sphingobacterium sp. E70]ULT26591.1 hypothetical protein KUH03_06985 [Sphingobacterium sp. E70]